MTGSKMTVKSTTESEKLLQNFRTEEKREFTDTSQLGFLISHLRETIDLVNDQLGPDD